MPSPHLVQRPTPFESREPSSSVLTSNSAKIKLFPPQISTHPLERQQQQLVSKRQEATLPYGNEKTHPLKPEHEVRLCEVSVRIGKRELGTAIMF